MHFSDSVKRLFNNVADLIFSQLQGQEAASLSLHGEESLFVRFNNNKVRQNTNVEQYSLQLLLQKNHRSSQVSFTLTADQDLNKQRALQWLNTARKECEELPEDPFQTPIVNSGSSETNYSGKLLSYEELLEAVIKSASGNDLAGLYCGGSLISANRNSAGQNHWFSNESFFMDYSLYNGEKAVKGVYAGSQWVQEEFAQSLARSKAQLSLMNRPKVELKPGAYRVFLAPPAVAEMASMFSWGAFGFNAYKQGHCGLQKLADKEKKLSPLISMRENFTMGFTHRFNDLGELAPETMDIIRAGELANLFVSTRTAKEYGVPGNFAASYEGPRALEILPGTLKESDVLKELGTGLYLSNLHYLNWSDRPTARITGMTRYACFWVEKGEIQGPINDLRFDESLYDCLGENLLAVTEFSQVDPQVMTYDRRHFGGSRIPGFLIKDFKFTL